MLAVLAMSVLSTPPIVANFNIASDIWTIERFTSKPDGIPSVRINRNGVQKLLIRADELGGDLIDAARTWYPVGYPVIVVSGHTGCSHGQETRFYAIHRGELSEMFRIAGEKGGPIFRDMDGDGKNEWLFDNADFWIANPPTKFLVYRQFGKRVSLWKELPNPRRVSLGMPSVRYF